MTIPDETKCARCGRDYGSGALDITGDEAYEEKTGFFLCNECLSENQNFIDSELCENFTPEELGKGGFFYSYMNSYFMYMIQRVRTIAGHAFIVIAGYSTKGHSKNSWHYKGMALDFWVKGLSALAAFRLLDRYWMGGLGFYPFREIINAHADGGKKRRWWQDKTGEIIYESNPKYNEIWGILLEKERVNHGGVTEVK